MLAHWRVFWSNAWLLGFAVVLSALVAVLSLTLPLFMLQVYDRVISARSVQTLWVLVGLAVFLLMGMGVLDYARRRIIARFAGVMQAELEPFLLAKGAGRAPDDLGGTLGTSDLDALRGFTHSGGVLTVIDALWIPLFIFVLFVLSPAFGTLALAGCGLLAILHGIEHWTAAYRWREAKAASGQVSQISQTVTQDSIALRGRLMGEPAAAAFLDRRTRSRNAAIHASDLSQGFRISGSTVRWILSVLTLALGASLVLNSSLTIGGMVAAVVLLGRVFHPFQAFLDASRGLIGARTNWNNIGKALARGDGEESFGVIPDPAAPALSVRQLDLMGDREKTPMLEGASLEVPRGQIVQVLGPMSSGKTLLAETLAGLRPVAKGKVSASGIRYDSLRPGALAAFVGYVPEVSMFFRGTIQDNIAGFPGSGTENAVVEAAIWVLRYGDIRDLHSCLSRRSSDLLRC